MADGARAVFVIQEVEDVERLLSAGAHMKAARWSSVNVIAIPKHLRFLGAYAPLSGYTTPQLMRQTALEDAASVARHAVATLPSHVNARHAAYDGWQARSFLAALRGGAFDAALFGARPPWPERMSVFRAARRGGAAVISYGKFDLDQEGAGT